MSSSLKIFRVSSYIFFSSTNIQLDPRQPISDLTVSHAQMVEIAKAVSYDSKIIVMDEPTSSLTEKEVKHLFKIINSLKSRGLGIIYISHKMEEIEQISDDITIMRDGQWVATEKVANLTTEKIINLMVGRDLSHRFPPKTNKIGSSLLKVESLTAAVSNSIQDINFELYEGEILGVAGLVGAKRTELIETIFGARKHSHGTISLKGELIENKTPHDGINHGFALVTEERRLTGIFDTLDITANATIANLNQYSRFGFLNQRKMIEDVNWVIDKMSVKTPSKEALIRNLSGGNQQKVIVGRWLLTEPDVLLMDEPTRGIDVGAKFEIYQLMNDLASKGKGIIVVSSEMPELLGITDRILVMSNGRVAGIVNTKETTQDELLILCSKYL